MCNCKKASNIIEKYGENVVRKSDSFIYFSRTIDYAIVALCGIIAFPILLAYGLVASLLGKKPVIRLPKGLSQNIGMALSNGKTV